MIALLLIFSLLAISTAPQSGSTDSAEAAAVETAADAGPPESVGAMNVRLAPASAPAPAPARINYSRGTGVVVIPLPPADKQGRVRIMAPLPPHSIIGKGAGLFPDMPPPSDDVQISRRRGVKPPVH